MYVPDLAKCLSGEELLLSWHDALQVLLQHEDRLSPRASVFFADGRVTEALSSNFPSFPPPSKESRSAFESKTSSINIIPSSSHQYDIDKVKENTLWLSKEADIDELEAFRLTILEWQYRPEARLKKGFCDAELATLRDLFGSEYCENVGLIQGSPFSRSESAFDSAEALRARLLLTYFDEKVRLLAVAREILQLRSTLDAEPDRDQDQRLSALPQAACKSFRNTAVDACEIIDACIEDLQSERSWPIHEQYQTEINESHATSNLQIIALALDILLLLSTHADDFISADVLLQYLQLVRKVDHFTSFQSDIVLQQTIIEHIRTASACTTLALLQPTATLLQLAENPETRQGSYIHQTELIHDIHDVFIDFAKVSWLPASLGVLAWGLLLLEVRNLASDIRETSEHRAMQKAIAPNSQDTRRSSISSAGSSHPSIFEDILKEAGPGPSGQDAADFLLTIALQSIGALDYVSTITVTQHFDTSPLSWSILSLLQDLVKQALPILGYSPALLSTQIAILAPSGIGIQHESNISLRPAINFIEDQFLIESFFDVAAARFPYEALPFLRLCRSLARADIFDHDTQYIAFRLKQLESFTQLATEGFAAYHTIREDENANLVSLNDTVSIFDLQQHRYLTQQPQSATVGVIPAQTVGEVISESMPPAIKWQYTFSGFALLGKWIELHREGLLANLVSVFEDPDEVVAEAIWTIAAVLQATYMHTKSHRDQTEAQNVIDGLLDDASTLLQEDVDLIGCIFELSEHQLQATRGQTPSIASRDLLAACVDFITTYADIHPSRIWPFLLRSSIYGMVGAKRNVLSFIGAVELPVQNFNLLESCSRLFKVIVNTAVPLSVRGVELSQPSQLRKWRLTASQRLNSSIVSNCTDVMLSALEVMGAWSFQDQTQKQRIFSNITSGFVDVIYHAFGGGEKYDSPTLPKTAFISAATSLVQALQNPGLQGTGAGPLLHQLITASVDPTLFDILGIPIVQTESSIYLIDILLQYSQINDDVQSEFETRMLSLLPVLVRIPINQPLQARNANALVLDVLRAILPASNSSVLGHLGAASSVSWIDTLRHMYGYPQISTDSKLLWQIYSQLITLDQQWLAIVLVTGSPPGRLRKENEQPKLQTQGQPCLQLALNKLSKPGDVDPRTLAGLLEFLLEAQRNWPSVSDSITAQSELFPELISWVCKRDISSKKETSQAIHNKIAALVNELAVLHLHRLMILKDEKVFSIFIPLLNWLAENAISIAAYNSSLHANLKRNFTMKYPTLDLTLFRRSGLIQAAYGPEYFFDIGLADKIIGEDQFWRSEGLGEQSFSAEFQRASINLSIVDSELALLRSLEYLSIEHAAFFARNRDVARIMAQMVTNCLVSNSQQSPTEKLFDNVFQTRADLAITLLRPLVAVKARGSDFPALLSSAWEAVRFRNGSYESAIINGDLEYWRSCLSILLLCLQFHVEKKARKANAGGHGALAEIDPFSNMYCEIARKIVGEGLRAVATALQAKYQDRNRSKVEDVTVTARDVSLLLSILQMILRLPTLPQFTVQLSEAFVSTGAAQSCVSLYSWSHLLMEDGQPVFADLASHCLASLSSLAIVAEDLAIEGIFARLLSAKFTQRLQTLPTGVSHLDKRPSGPLMYSVWGQGILPICLSLLHGVGGSVVGEVSDFLNQFTAQLNKATLALSGAPSQAAAGGGILTLTVATELATLSLISYILDSFRDAGASAGVDSDAISPLEGFDQNKRSLALDIRDAVNQDQGDRKRRTVATNEKEARWEREGKLDWKIVTQLKQAIKCLDVDLSLEDEKA